MPKINLIYPKELIADDEIDWNSFTPLDDETIRINDLLDHQVYGKFDYTIGTCRPKMR